MLNQEMSQEERRKNEDYKERFRLACKADPLSIEFARTCSSAIALLARTVSTFQMTNEIFHALTKDQEEMKSEEELSEIAKQIMTLCEGMQCAQILMMLARLGASCAFTEYMIRLKVEQSKH